MDLEPAASLAVLETVDGYRRHFMEAERWQPYVTAACRQHDLSCRSIRPGLAGTFPTFIADEHHVVKFYGRMFDGEANWRVEQEAARLMSGTPGIPVAHILAAGTLETAPTWKYLIFDFIAGISIGEVYAQVSLQDKLSLARWLGVALRGMHRIEVPAGNALPRLSPKRMRNWFASRWAKEREKWPGHLASQVEAYLDTNAALIQGASGNFIHADLTRDHILGWLEKYLWRTLAVIDFGDAMLGNLFYELSALHLDLFDCDRRLLAAFLDAYGLSPDERRDFVRKAMATSLLHQFDIYAHLFTWKPKLRKARTLDELAERLWMIDHG